MYLESPRNSQNHRNPQILSRSPDSGRTREFPQDFLGLYCRYLQGTRVFYHQSSQEQIQQCHDELQRQGIATQHTLNHQQWKNVCEAHSRNLLLRLGTSFTT